MNNKFVKVEITDHDSLMKVCDLLHDAKFDLSTFEVDQSRGTWKASFEREFFEDPDLMKSESRLLIFTKYTFPLIFSQLTLKNVASCKIEDKSKIGTYIFNECHCFKENAYEFRFCEDMKMIIKFNDKPCGELRDINLLPKKSEIFDFRNPFKNKTCKQRV